MREKTHKGAPEACLDPVSDRSKEVGIECSFSSARLFCLLTAPVSGFFSGSSDKIQTTFRMVDNVVLTPK